MAGRRLFLMPKTKGTTRETLPPIPLGQRLFLRAFELARWMNCSRAQVHELDRCGYIPSPVHVGESRMWRTAEMRAWHAAGCPQRDAWKWQPAYEVKIADALDLLRRRRDALAEECRDLESRQARGETIARVVVA